MVSFCACFIEISSCFLRKGVVCCMVRRCVSWLLSLHTTVLLGIAQQYIQLRFSLSTVASRHCLLPPTLPLYVAFPIYTHPSSFVTDFDVCRHQYPILLVSSTPLPVSEALRSFRSLIWEVQVIEWSTVVRDSHLAVSGSFWECSLLLSWVTVYTAAGVTQSLEAPWNISHQALLRWCRWFQRSKQTEFLQQISFFKCCLMGT